MTTRNAPVAAADRIDYLDILRGIAVLAILVVNIKAMFHPFAFYNNATLWTGEYDKAIAMAQAFLVEDKWRTIFTALFGAGLALVADRAAAKGQGSLGLLMRRNVFLLIFGLIHLILIWMGDILTIYALVGFLAVWFRNASIGALRIWSVVFLIIGLIWVSGFSYMPAVIPEVRAEMEPMMWGTDPALLKEEIAANLTGVSEQIEARLGGAFGFIVFFFLLGGFWLLNLGVMLAGMWGYRSGYLTGERSVTAYLIAIILGGAIAFGLDIARWTMLENSGWTYDAYAMSYGLNLADGLAGAVFWSALIALLVKAGWKARAFAAAGRMAFSNYIACSLIGTTLAGGHAFGLFGQLTNLQLTGIMAAIWIALLIWSPLWLARFRYGPLEWLWRSLTYMRVQPLRRST